MSGYTKEEIDNMSEDCKSAYNYFIESLKDFVKNAPLKWKRWKYRRDKKKKSLRLKD
jgi:lauroyl/myristoyl acyltransferase